MTDDKIMLVTIGYGGWTLYVLPTDTSTSRLQGYGDDWRKYLEPGQSHFIPADTPVVDCTVEECNTSGYSVRGPMFGQRLAPNEVSELFAGTKEWDGQFASGMAQVGLSVYLAHAAFFGTKITYAGSGENFPASSVTPTGTPDAKNTVIAYGVALDPTATIEAVMTGAIMNEGGN